MLLPLLIIMITDCPTYPNVAVEVVVSVAEVAGVVAAVVTRPGRQPAALDLVGLERQ